MNAPLTLWWAGPGLAAQYRADLLQSADRQRAQMTRSARAERDWRVSRALLQQVSAGSAGASDSDKAAPVSRSLSHSGGHAVVATAPAGWQVGVDLEALRPRDTARLAPWCCSVEEAGALAGSAADADRLRAFYLLWTLKESFIKAAGLAFPADMRGVGLTGAGLPWNGWRLRAPGAGWRAWSAIVDDAWMVSVAWRAPDTAEASEASDASAAQAPPDAGAGPVPLWRIAQGIASPRITIAGRWS
ncbi:4'-phosphopantetheinyl transferase family protein [Bordetella genomosp. 9]|uniref:4'-phosphopantetheinyl transferase family protein n=1 Tax=Bordetella genomosp. 9 TaxID=1416803 RepID=UPI0011773332|nr:4'-phosphopantetheinyl transferase superfamily protein [Bordetella genomosp. 9]